MKQIILSTGDIAQIDDQLFAQINAYSWNLSGYGYAITSTRPQPNIKIAIYMHILVLLLSGKTVPQGYKGDHINRNKLDNQINNLRVVSKKVNSYNSELSEVNTSGFKGVSWEKRRNKWRAYIHKIQLGEYRNIEDAIYARLNAEANLKL